MAVGNLYVLALLFGVTAAFSVSITNLKSRGDDDSLKRHRVFKDKSRQDYIAVEIGNSGDETDFASREENPRNTPAKGPWFPETGSPDAADLAQRRMKKDRNSMLPPWTEFCRMLNMRECNRYKRSAIYRAVRTLLSSRRR